MTQKYKLKFLKKDIIVQCSPKRFLKNKKKSLTDIAYDCGYYDQSHFINDFKEFSGYHPSQYFSGQTEGTTWKD